MPTHLLVTNDFPPKIGGIQSYLWELWRRLDPDQFCVLTSPHSDAAQWDAQQPFRVVRTKEPVLLPHPWMIEQVNRLAEETNAEFVMIDPAVPLGVIGSRLDRPYGVVVHGAEVSIPAQIPISRQVLGRVLRGAGLVVAAGGFPALAAQRCAGRPIPTVVVPPGVDPVRFVPLGNDERRKARASFGLDETGPVVVCVSRLVPRKGFDTVIRAAAVVHAQFPNLVVAIAGSGRDLGRLERLAERLSSPVRFLGRVPDEQLPALYGCGDVFAMVNRTRWAGLEQEGFGIVFLEAAAAGVAQLGGASGGAADAVADGQTGLLVDPPDDLDAAVAALTRLLTDAPEREAMATRGRQRAVEEFSYDVLAARLSDAIDAWHVRINDDAGEVGP